MNGIGGMTKLGELVAEVKTVLVKKQCPHCKTGEMIPTNIILDTYPGQYEHECNCCGYREYYFDRFPYIKQIPIEDFREPMPEEV